MIKIEIGPEKEELIINKNFIKFGASSSNDLIFLEEDTPELVGVIEVKQEYLEIKALHSEIYLNGNLLKSFDQIKNEDTITFSNSTFKVVDFSTQNPGQSTKNDREKLRKELLEDYSQLKPIFEFIDKNYAD